MSRYAYRMTIWGAFWLLVAIAACRAEAAEIRIGARSSSGLGETSIMPVVELELDIDKWRAGLAGRGAEKLDGGSGSVAGLEVHRHFAVGQHQISVGLRYARLDVEGYAINALAPVVSWETTLTRLELSVDDTERQTIAASLLFRWEWLWWRMAAVDYGAAYGSDPGNGVSFAVGYRWRP